MKKGDKIKDNKIGSTHIIESIESFGEDTVIFTEDSKCLPMEQVSVMNIMVIGDVQKISLAEYAIQKSKTQ